MAKAFVRGAQFDQRLFNILVEELVNKKPKEIFDLKSGDQLKVGYKYRVRQGLQTVLRLLRTQMEYPYLVIDEVGDAEPMEIDKFLDEAKALYGILSKYAR
jgi:hypothetical protein